jgi:hypothetical protein
MLKAKSQISQDISAHNTKRLSTEQRGRVACELRKLQHKQEVGALKLGAGGLSLDETSQRMLQAIFSAECKQSG